jgi:hypothetical protein
MNKRNLHDNVLTVSGSVFYSKTRPDDPLNLNVFTIFNRILR